jgi:tetratricopeptide (TPR) repeat protein
VDDPAFALVAAGRALASIGEWDLAAEALSKATRLLPDYAEAWAFLGEIQQHTDEDGLPALTEAIRLDPTSVAANSFLALYWHRQEKYDQALVYLTNAASYDPENPALQLEIGNTLAILGNLDDAHKHYQRAVDLAPNDPANLRQLAAFSINYDYRVQEVALPAARQAVLIDRKDPASQDIFGQTYARLENPLLAERFFKRALQADPDYAPAHLHLGALYLLQSDWSLAEYHLSRASTLSSLDAPAAAEASRLLQRYFP